MSLHPSFRFATPPQGKRSLQSGAAPEHRRPVYRRTLLKNALGFEEFERQWPAPFFSTTDNWSFPVVVLL